MSITIEDGMHILVDWADLPSTGPVPGAWLIPYTESRLAELQLLARDNVTTDVYILYEYHRENLHTSGELAEYIKWRSKAAELGVEKAVIDLHKSGQIPPPSEAHIWGSFIFLTLVLLASCGILVRMLIVNTKHRTKYNGRIK